VIDAAERGMGMVNKANELARANGWFMTRQFENEANPEDPPWEGRGGVCGGWGGRGGAAGREEG